MVLPLFFFFCLTTTIIAQQNNQPSSDVTSNICYSTTDRFRQASVNLLFRPFDLRVLFAFEAAPKLEIDCLNLVENSAFSSQLCDSAPSKLFLCRSPPAAGDTSASSSRCQGIDQFLTSPRQRLVFGGVNDAPSEWRIEWDGRSKSDSCYPRDLRLVMLATTAAPVTGNVGLVVAFIVIIIALLAVVVFYGGYKFKSRFLEFFKRRGGGSSSSIDGDTVPSSPTSKENQQDETSPSQNGILLEKPELLLQDPSYDNRPHATQIVFRSPAIPTLSSTAQPYHSISSPLRNGQPFRSTKSPPKLTGRTARDTQLLSPYVTLPTQPSLYQMSFSSPSARHGWTADQPRTPFHIHPLPSTNIFEATSTTTDQVVLHVGEEDTLPQLPPDEVPLFSPPQLGEQDGAVPMPTQMPFSPRDQLMCTGCGKNVWSYSTPKRCEVTGKGHW